MAIQSTVQYTGTTLRITNASFTADNDTTGTIAHGFGGLTGFASAQVKVTLVPLIATGIQSSANIALTTVDNTNVTIAKASATGSSTTAPQFQVIMEAPHSMVK